MFRRGTGSFNGDTFWTFLKDFRTATAHGPRRVTISDNAGYCHSRLHKGWRADQAPRFELTFLPPYSPELNPVERVWKFTRPLGLHNRYFGVLDGVVAAVEDQFSQWTRPNATLPRLCPISQDVIFSDGH